MKRGQNLIIDDTSGLEEVIGGYRENKSGIDAYARTMGYEPQHAGNVFDTDEDAESLVKYLTRGELFNPRELKVEAGM